MEALLVIDTHSASITFAAYDGTSSPGELNLIAKGHVALVDGETEFFVRSANCSHPEISCCRPADGVFDHDRGLGRMFNWLDRRRGLKVAAVVHRLADGGQGYPASVLVTDAVLEDLEARASHDQAHHLKAMRFLRERLPTVAQVACFDSGLHRPAQQTVPVQGWSRLARVTAPAADQDNLTPADAPPWNERVSATLMHVFASMAPAARPDTCPTGNYALLTR